jgi:hypothetical protein
MGLLSRLLQRRADRAAEATDLPGHTYAGETDALTGIGTLISQFQHFQGSPGGAEQMNRVMAEAGEMQAEIREIAARHGFDGSAAGAGQGDPEAMQREIMEAMARHGFGMPGMGTAQAPAPPAADVPEQTGPIRDPLSGS